MRQKVDFENGFQRVHSTITIFHNTSFWIAVFMNHFSTIGKAN